MAGARCPVRGASRTDAGVHAHGQVAAFDAPRRIERSKWERGLNGTLPDDIGVQRADEVAPGYDPRRDSAFKTYRYVLRLGAHRDPLMVGRAWQIDARRARPRPAEGRHGPADFLDLDAMAEAARRLEGTHDFRAFRSAADQRDNTIRTLTRVEIVRGFAQREDLVAIEIRGNAFMHNMVRILAGTLVEVGRERMDPEDVEALLGEHPDRGLAGETAPACGLYLVAIELGRTRVG